MTHMDNVHTSSSSLVSQEQAMPVDWCHRAQGCFLRPQERLLGALAVRLHHHVRTSDFEHEANPASRSRVLQMLARELRIASFQKRTISVRICGSSLLQSPPSAGVDFDTSTVRCGLQVTVLRSSSMWSHAAQVTDAELRPATTSTACHWSRQQSVSQNAQQSGRWKDDLGRTLGARVQAQQDA
ncbi:hypothetical protein BDV96DRAFT_601070 [Lophiotrema nucula]|uniref:Uncharacterized protein n=1 Tax=Lophiotrema nucula TaxID=690887 RepID=A0A6A5Z3D3_9PLEO|nr:hypothetical protein BDV96DRAFT_601070 [Lophiotrema nucula]